MWNFTAIALTFLIACCLSAGATPSTVTGEGGTIYFSVVVSNAPATLNSSGVLSAVDRAIQFINSDPTILPRHHLQRSLLSTQCNRTRTLELFNADTTFTDVPTNQSLVAVIGAGCSLATEALTTNLDIPIISYASTSAALSDRSVYPNLFRTVPSDESLAPALATLMNYYGWRTLSILTEQESQFTTFLSLLQTALSKAAISVEKSVNFTVGNLSEAAESIFAGESRIIMLNANPQSALFYLCKAFKEERFYPGYVWITPGWYQQGWWRADEHYLHSLNCTTSDIEQQLNRSLVLLAHPNTSSLNITEPFNSSSYAMDAVTTLALALNKTLEDPSLNLSLQTAIQESVFSGTSGVVRFDDSGNRLGPVVLLQQFRIDQNESASLHIVARIEGGTLSFVNGEANSTVWPDNTGIPPTIVVVNVVKTSVYAYMIFLVTVGVLLSIICLLFNIIFRNRKVVKLTSPNLNYVIVFGTIMLLIGNIFLPFPSRNITLVAIFCTIARIFLSIGYDICFVVALVKTMRVAYIFFKVTPTKKKVQDWHLLLLSAGIISIEVIFTIPLLTLTVVNGDARLIRDSENPTFINDDGYTVTHRIITCGLSTTYIIYFSLALVYKVIIHIIGLVLAFLTRKVKVDPLNDSRYSAAIIYCSCVMLVLAVIVVFALSGVNVYAGVWTSFVLIEVCVFLGLTFIPKMVSLYRDPQGKKIFDGMDSASYHVTSTVPSTIVEDGKSEH